MDLDDVGFLCVGELEAEVPVDGALVGGIGRAQDGAPHANDQAIGTTPDTPYGLTQQWVV
jgi:hypothetical protein